MILSTLVHEFLYMRIFLFFVRFSDANCRKSIVSLIKRIGETYVTDKRQRHFVKDLMSFTVPGLLQLSTDDNEVKKLFIEMIHTYIRKNGLQEVILEQILSFVVS